MRSKLLETGPALAWALILQTGEEFTDSLNRFAREKDLNAASFTAIGAFQKAVLGYYEWDRKDYKRIPLDEQVEVLALTGDISLEDGQRKLHAHAVVGRSDGSVRGGHLMEAHIRPTLEIVIRESPQTMRRAYDPESGLSLLVP